MIWDLSGRSWTKNQFIWNT